jgi:pro-kumamolisin-like protein/putative Ig domain-containing protein
VDLSLHPRIIHRLAVALAAAVVLLVASLAAVASAAPLRGGSVGALMRVGRAPAVPTGATARGALPRSSVIDATVALQPRDPAALTAYAHAVSTPGSSLYHHYLSVAQFARRFAPGVAAVASVRAALQAQGLHPGPLAANGLSLDVSASVGAMSTAFATSFERYEVAGGHAAFANTAAPALPASISGLVQSVIGLDSLQVPHPAGLAKTRRGAPHAHASATTAPGEAAACTGADQAGYTAGEIASAYGLSDLYAAGDGGSGTTVAVFELEPYSATDIAGYQSCYQTATPVTNVTVDGGPGSGAGSGEAALDIEDVIGLAPNTSILVYSGKNSGAGAIDTYRAIITQNRAKVISTSWGLCEPQEGASAASTENTLFQEAAVQGQTIFAASGDHGVKDCMSGRGSTAVSVDDPASQPYVTGVGGTSLTAVGPPPTESVWNSAWNSKLGRQTGSGGGGVSAFWGVPSYQSGIALPQSTLACTGAGTSCREVPDVSADADILTGYSIYYGGGWSIFGGTSAAAPTWAALAALANASVACTGKTVGFANPALYQAARSGYTAYFNDVATGNNSFGGLTGYSAAAGYDMASGLGSPKGGPLAAVLCGSTWTPPAPAPAPAPPPAPVVTLTHPPVQAARVGQPVRVQLHATDSANQALTYRASGLPAGLAIASATGLITGSPSRAGKASATVTVTDTSGSAGQATVAWTVAGRPTITGGLSVNAQGRPSLALKVGAGRNAPPIQSIVVVPSRQIRFAKRARDLSRGITVRNGSGHRLKSAAKLRRGDLVVTLRSASVRSASLRVTVPAITLIKAKKTSGKHHGAAVLQSLTVTVTDALSFRTAFSVR